MSYAGKVHTAKIVDLVTGMIAEADLEDFDLEDLERSVTAIVWSTGCPVYDRIPWLLGQDCSRVLGWQDLVEPGSLIVLAQTPNKASYQA